MILFTKFLVEIISAPQRGVPPLRPHYHTITRTRAVPVHVPVPIPAPPAQVITHVENVPIHDPPAVIKVPERGPTHVATWQRLDCWPCLGLGSNDVQWCPMMSNAKVQKLWRHLESFWSLKCSEVHFLKISMDASLHSVFSNCSVSSCSSSILIHLRWTATSTRNTMSQYLLPVHLNITMCQSLFQCRTLARCFHCFARKRQMETDSVDKSGI